MDGYDGYAFYVKMDWVDFLSENDSIGMFIDLPKTKDDGDATGF